MNTDFFNGSNWTSTTGGAPGAGADVQFASDATVHLTGTTSTIASLSVLNGATVNLDLNNVADTNHIALNLTGNLRVDDSGVLNVANSGATLSILKANQVLVAARDGTNPTSIGTLNVDGATTEIEASTIKVAKCSGTGAGIAMGTLTVDDGAKVKADSNSYFGSNADDGGNATVTVDNSSTLESAATDIRSAAPALGQPGTSVTVQDASTWNAAGIAIGDTTALSLELADAMNISVEINFGATLNSGSAHIQGKGGGNVTVGLNNDSAWIDSGDIEITGRPQFDAVGNPTTLSVTDSELDTDTVFLGDAAQDGNCGIIFDGAVFHARHVSVGEAGLLTGISITDGTEATIYSELSIGVGGTVLVTNSTLSLPGWASDPPTPTGVIHMSGGRENLFGGSATLTVDDSTVSALQLEVVSYGPQIMLDHESEMDISGSSDIGPAFIPPAPAMAPQTLTIKGSSTFETFEATIGQANIHIFDTGYMSVDSSSITHMNPLAGIQIDPGGAVDMPGSVSKDVSADISGGGTFNGDVLTPGENADLIPGDALARDPYGEVTYSTGPINDPTGTLEINGDLSSASGFTLDAVLDPSTSAGASNLLHITGTASIAGTCNLFLAPDQFNTEFQSGQSFTLLTADGGLTGTFSNLAAGVHNPPTSQPSSWNPLNLPLLPLGLRWLVTYTSTSLILSLIPIAKATGLSATASPANNGYVGLYGAAISWTNHDLGATSISIQVQDPDTGNYFTIYSGLDPSHTTFISTPSDAYGFEAGGSYNIRVRTVTAAGAVFSDPYTLTISNFSTGSLAYTATADPDADGSVIVSLNSFSYSASSNTTYTLAAKSSLTGFSDRWITLGGMSKSAADPLLSTSDACVGEFSLDAFHGAALADSFYIIATTTSGGATTITATPISVAPTFALTTPTVTATYSSTGVTLSWSSISGASVYDIVNVADLNTATGANADDHTTTTGNTITLSYTSYQGFQLGAKYVVIATGTNAVTGKTLFSAAQTSPIDAGRAAAPTHVSTVLGVNGTLIIWDDMSNNEDNFAMRASSNGVDHWSSFVSAAADTDQFFIAIPMSEPNPFYSVVATRTSPNSNLTSTYTAAVTAEGILMPVQLSAALITNGDGTSAHPFTAILVFNQPINLDDAGNFVIDVDSNYYNLDLSWTTTGPDPLYATSLTLTLNDSALPYDFLPAGDYTLQIADCFNQPLQNLPAFTLTFTIP